MQDRHLVCRFLQQWKNAVGYDSIYTGVESMVVEEYLYGCSGSHIHTKEHQEIHAGQDHGRTADDHNKSRMSCSVGTQPTAMAFHRDKG